MKSPNSVDVLDLLVMIEGQPCDLGKHKRRSCSTSDDFDLIAARFPPIVADVERYENRTYEQENP